MNSKDVRVQTTSNLRRLILMNHKGNHLWLMVLGCLAPIAALGAIFLFNISVSTVFLAGLILLCPLLHLWMMRGGGHAHGEETSPEMPVTLTKEQ